MTAEHATRREGESLQVPLGKGLRADALGLLSSLVIGVASTAPAYSLAASLGLVNKAAGIKAPAILLLAFVPMLCIAFAFAHLNRGEPDCGTSFRWVSRAFGRHLGPYLGWMSGWSVILAGVIVMASLAQIAGQYALELAGLSKLAQNKYAVMAMGVVFIAVLTYICVVGIEAAARLQYFLLATELVVLLVFSAVALYRVYHGTAAPTAVKPALSWLSPSGVGSGPMATAFLAALFIYWGWDTAVACNEETRDARRTPGVAILAGVVMLLVLYVVSGIAAQAFAGPDFLVKNSSDVLVALGKGVLGSPLDKLLLVSVLTSAAASAQTTILPTARSALSMATHGALPEALGRVSPRWKTPHVATLAMGALSAGFYMVLTVVSTNLLADAILALGLMIAFNYGFVGLACVLTYRQQLFESARMFVTAGLLPLLGSASLIWVFFRSMKDLAGQGSGKIFGVGTPLVAGLGLLVLGVVLMLVRRAFARSYFRPEL
jgi:amino acid transporter